MKFLILNMKSYEEFWSEKVFLIHTSECSLNKTRFEMLIFITFYIDEFKNWYCRIVTYIASTNRSYNSRPLIVGY